MKTLKVFSSNINERHIDEAVRALRDGMVVAYPTDTLYAMGCNALNNGAIERLCRLKGIDPKRNSLSVICSDISMASEYARIDNRAFRYMREYLPGPFTFILPAATTLPKVFKGRHTVGIRIPDNPVATTLAQALGNPVLTTSIECDDTDAEAIALSIANQAQLMLMADDALPDASTVVDLTDSSDPQILRQGRGHFEP